MAKPEDVEYAKKAIKNRAVANLQTFGYPTASLDNLTTDSIFIAFFIQMLEDAIYETPSKKAYDHVRQAINELMQECEGASK